MTDSAQNFPVSQKLAQLDIFTMLGVTGTEDEKEQFLDELQDLVWQDFVDVDLMDKLEDRDMDEVEGILADDTLSVKDQQEKLVGVLQRIMPDFEDVLLNKALELKEDMLRERIAGLMEYYKDRAAELAKVNQAEDLVNDEKYKEAVDLLNGLEK